MHHAYTHIYITLDIHIAFTHTHRNLFRNIKLHCINTKNTYIHAYIAFFWIIYMHMLHSHLHRDKFRNIKLCYIKLSQCDPTEELEPLGKQH